MYFFVFNLLYEPQTLCFVVHCTPSLLREQKPKSLAIIIAHTFGSCNDF
nr:MAG TPA: hypothetical protein [Caudoviricetes sp.]